MSTTARTAPVDVAIIGGGAAGTLTALHLLRLAQEPLVLAIVEPAQPLAQGIAYATPWPEHLLNVPAAKMSAFPDLPEDFVSYLVATSSFPGESAVALAQRYVSRHHFASYLQQRLHELAAVKPVELLVIAQTARALRPDGAGYRLQLDGDRCLHAAQVVLATGNCMRPLALPGAQLFRPPELIPAWDYTGVRQRAGEHAVAILGTGLSMVDSVRSLLAAGHRGPVHVISRRGVLPLPHAHHSTMNLEWMNLIPMRLCQRMRWLRQHARQLQEQGLPWQALMEALRPSGQVLWTSLDSDDQRRFLRHAVRYWDVHRHRIASEAAEDLRLLQTCGQLEVHRARLHRLERHGHQLQLSGRNGLTGQQQQWNVATVINATGVETRASALRQPLLQQLLADGLVRPGPHGLGLDTVGIGHCVQADGTVQRHLNVLGSLRAGNLWETLAIPELRQQALGLAAQILEVTTTVPPNLATGRTRA
ncbi:FAD/NAD(P)-binding protein [Stenotrophomonas maltophilia]|uniref:FAD/NAD(P)-binding protein n=1 Tax=Stenotrophomonas maltophilia TaxID=40324 RepID=UPI00155925CF|nr:FAD/NAD(P)-binding protein [Stenotrophomonas maltophilia]